MTSADSNTAAININPNAASSGNMTMAGGSMGADAAYSPPDGSYSPPTFTYTGAEGESTANETMANMGDMSGLAASSQGDQRDRRYSDEWDASKVPPSRFQKRKGSIYSTPGSRDGQVDNNYAAKFHAKHAELGYTKTK